MNPNSFSIKFYPHDKRIKNNGAPICCRITVNRKKTEFFTQQVSPLKKWDEEKQRVKGSPETNAVLAGIETKLRSIYNQFILSGNTPTAKDIKDAHFGKDQVRTTLIEYYLRFESEIKELPDQYTSATLKKYSTIRIHLEKHLEEIGKKGILLSAFNLKNVNDFDYYLRTKAKLNINTTTKYLKQLKAIFNRSIQFGILKENPFINYKFKNEKTHRNFLTNEEITKLEIYKTKNESLLKVRDCFIFSIYTGLRFSDIDQLKPNDIVKDKKGNHWLSVSVQKTGEPLKFPLVDKALKIITRYKKYAEITGKLLPVISNQKINSYLKIISDQSGIKKNLTFHVARYTFATTVTLSNKIPIEIVSKLLGHTTIRTTQIYAKITNEYLLETNKILNKVL